LLIQNYTEKLAAGKEIILSIVKKLSDSGSPPDKSKSTGMTTEMHNKKTG
jgi:hypothetical protein